MKKRVLTGVIAGGGTIVLLTIGPVWLIRLVVMFFCVLAMYELLSAIGLAKHRSLLGLSLLFAAVTPFMDLFGDWKIALTVIGGYVFLIAVIQIVFHQTLKFDRTLFVLCTSLVVVLPLAFLAYIVALPQHGRAYLFLTMISAWLADIGAYFVGTFFGKHKLCPIISPKKTVEGFFGGMVSSVLFCLIGAWIYQTLVLGAAGQQVIYWQVALVGLIMSPISVLGDLFCSVIKRQNGIKDFGNILPGHGGALDRFDSLIFVAPLMYLVCSWLPMIQ